MNTLKPFYITTTLPYVNDSPHIGHAIDFIQADVLARINRLLGREVFFNTGTDEHGQKIAEAAKEDGIGVQSYVDKYAQEFKRVVDLLDISVDRFIRTTESGHIDAAQKLWQLAEANGDIYKKSYKGLYCVGCEAFMKEGDLDDSGACPYHLGKQLEEVEEENYFFKLSNHKGALQEYLNKRESVIPDWRRREALQILEDFGDFSISRPSSRLEWGIPVPGDDTQVMYVWFDALSNYISTLGYPDENPDGNFAKYWQGGEVVQIAGKDQVKFQSVMWQAMLMSAGIKNTGTVFYHGFINSGGKKMSKSLGNVISPQDLIDRYGAEAVRYILLRHVHPTDDSDLTWEKMDEWYTANLVNGLGNLVARVMQMSQTHLPSRQEAPSDIGLDEEYIEAFNNFEFNKAVDILWSWISEVDEQITIQEPFKIVKVDKEKAQKMIIKYVDELNKIALHLESIMPKASKIIKQAIKENKKPENMFKRLE